MLVNLYIENYVLFDKLNLTFKDGFTSLTGDTGAGKSLIIDALGYLTGDRLNVNISQDDKKSVFIEGQFEFKNSLTIDKIINSGIPNESPFIVSREITPENRSLLRINQRSVTLTFIKDLFKNELDIHSQKDNQYLLNKNIHLELLDTYAKHPDLLISVKTAYKAYMQVFKEIKTLEATVFNEAEIEFIKSQIEEIEKVNVSQKEIDDLNTRLKEINNYEAIFNNLSAANKLLSSNKGIIELMFEAKDSLASLNTFSDYNEVSERLETAYFEVSDLADEVASLQSNLEFDEYELNNIESRLYEINHLLKKYNNSMEIMNDRLKIMQDKVEKFESREKILEKLNKDLKVKELDLLNKSKILSKSRKSVINKLEKEVIANLKDLHLSDAKFKVDIKESDYSKVGIDDVEFLVAMNKGSQLLPLSKVASGGELSRLMLGLKVIFSKLFGISTVIFDEIDTGVSGAIATAIGVKMNSLSKTSQVFAITHLAQVAACSNHHYHVEKFNVNNLAKTSVTKLKEAEKIEKLAIMSTGLSSKASLKAASELYKKSQQLVSDKNG